MTVSSSFQLRPLTAGELLDRAILLYRRNFFTFIGIVALVLIPLTLFETAVSWLSISGFFSHEESAEIVSAEYQWQSRTGAVLFIVNWLAIRSIAAAALTRAAADNYLGGSSHILDTYRKIGWSWLALLGALGLVILTGLLLFLWFLLPLVGWLTGIGPLVFLGGVIVPLIAPIIVLEKHPVKGAIRRSWDLARRRFWRTLGVVTVLFIFALLVVSGPALLVDSVLLIVMGNLADAGTNQFLIQTVVELFAELLFKLIYLPVQLTAVTLLYLDLRVRTEGFDLALRANSLAATPMSAIEAMAQPLAPAQMRLITRLELVYFVLLSFIILGLPLGLIGLLALV